MTDVPAQIAPDGDAAMLTDGVTLAFTIIVIVFDEATVEVRQFPPVTVIIQVTASLFNKDDVVYVLDTPFCWLTPFILKS